MKLKNDFLLRRNGSQIEMTNFNYYSGEFDFSTIWCPRLPHKIDYIALYDSPSEYEKTDNTAIAFFLDDVIWNGQDGLFASIYYENTKRQAFFKRRFARNDQRPPIFIEPDVSLFGDMDRASIIWAYKQMATISTFLVNECGGIVIPLITFSTEKDFPLMIEGKQDTEVAAFSLFGYMRDTGEGERIVNAVKYTCDHLKALKEIVVYTSCPIETRNVAYFEYAIRKGIEIVIPDNHWKDLNSAKIMK